MKNNILGKILMLTIVSILILTSFAPVVSSNIQNQSKKEQTVKIDVFDSSSGCKTGYYLSEKDVKKIIALMEGKISQESFTRQIEEKLNILSGIGVISSETANNLVKKLSMQQKFLEEKRLLPKIGPLFDLFNFFNGVFFGLKGQRTFNNLDLPVYKFPFFNSNITALFSIYSKFIGSGCIFTLGTLGFKYIYEFDMDKYDFPYLPEISGSVIGFTGIFLKMYISDELGAEYEGTYFIGVGMDIVSIWDNLEN